MRLRRRALVGLPAILLVAVLGLTGCTSSGAGSGSSGSGPSTGSSSPPVAPPASGAGYRYIWTARAHSRFTSTDLARLGSSFHIVIIEKTHDGGDFAGQDADARALAAEPGHPEVLVNFLTRIITKPFLAAAGSAFKSEWILHDSSGQPIPFKAGKAGGKGWWVDLSNPDYRHFIESWVVRRLHAAPWAGVMFDNFHASADDTVSAQLPAGKAAALDTALPKLLAETRAAIGPSKLLLFNGTARSPASGKNIRSDRQLEYVPDANGAQDEFYCYQDAAGTFRPASDMWADIGTYHRLETAGATMLRSVKIRTSDAQSRAEQIKRFCFAAMLMDEVPGHSLIQFKAYSDEDAGPQIEDDTAAEQALALGAPTGDAAASGGVWSRGFASGWVVANPGDAPVQVRAPRALTSYQGARPAGHLAAGSEITVPAHDALFFTT